MSMEGSTLHPLYLRYYPKLTTSLRAAGRREGEGTVAYMEKAGVIDSHHDSVLARK